MNYLDILNLSNLHRLSRRWDYKVCKVNREIRRLMLSTAEWKDANYQTFEIIKVCTSKIKS